MAFDKYSEHPNVIVASIARQMEALYSEYQADQLSEKEFLHWGDKILDADKFARRIDDKGFMDEIRAEFAVMKEISRSLL